MTQGLLLYFAAGVQASLAGLSSRFFHLIGGYTVHYFSDILEVGVSVLILLFPKNSLKNLNDGVQHNYRAFRL
ncbi:hypothetical protein K0T92_03200 [Paenibacillus oenotherae]|uniref:Uncharacterized protein n=1 Tax=Paenibacillus oenotherae TaxID=1435645 RepID=A0ABS7D1D3_9BACL|nr:hypothetical protein [Paenibacillus oenotherae]MBW7473750.1 hypothetical protein [Paenibacillus oenotherae]